MGTSTRGRWRKSGGVHVHTATVCTMIGAKDPTNDACRHGAHHREWAGRGRNTERRKCGRVLVRVVGRKESVERRESRERGSRERNTDRGDGREARPRESESRESTPSRSPYVRDVLGGATRSGDRDNERNSAREKDRSEREGTREPQTPSPQNRSITPPGTAEKKESSPPARRPPRLQAARGGFGRLVGTAFGDVMKQREKEDEKKKEREAEEERERQIRKERDAKRKEEEAKQKEKERKARAREKEKERERETETKNEQERGSENETKNKDDRGKEREPGTEWRRDSSRESQGNRREHRTPPTDTIQRRSQHASPVQIDPPEPQTDPVQTTGPDRKLNGPTTTHTVEFHSPEPVTSAPRPPSRHSPQTDSSIQHIGSPLRPEVLSPALRPVSPPTHPNVIRQQTPPPAELWHHSPQYQHHPPPVPNRDQPRPPREPQAVPEHAYADMRHNPHALATIITTQQQQQQQHGRGPSPTEASPMGYMDMRRKLSEPEIRQRSIPNAPVSMGQFPRRPSQERAPATASNPGPYGQGRANIPQNPNGMWGRAGSGGGNPNDDPMGMGYGRRGGSMGVSMPTQQQPMLRQAPSMPNIQPAPPMQWPQPPRRQQNMGPGPPPAQQPSTGSSQQMAHPQPMRTMRRDTWQPDMPPRDRGNDWGGVSYGGDTHTAKALRSTMSTPTPVMPPADPRTGRWEQPPKQASYPSQSQPAGPGGNSGISGWGGPTHDQWRPAPHEVINYDPHSWGVEAPTDFPGEDLDMGTPVPWMQDAPLVPVPVGVAGVKPTTGVDTRAENGSRVRNLGLSEPSSGPARPVDVSHISVVIVVKDDSDTDTDSEDDVETEYTPSPRIGDEGGFMRDGCTEEEWKEIERELAPIRKGLDRMSEATNRVLESHADEYRTHLMEALAAHKQQQELDGNTAPFVLQAPTPPPTAPTPPVRVKEYPGVGVVDPSYGGTYQYLPPGYVPAYSYMDLGGGHHFVLAPQQTFYQPVMMPYDPNYTPHHMQQQPKSMQRTSSTS